MSKRIDGYYEDADTKKLKRNTIGIDPTLTGITMSDIMEIGKRSLAGEPPLLFPPNLELPLLPLGKFTLE
jgi:hypothetical protein